MTDTVGYQLKGHLLGACSWDWGCPCSFEAPPTYGHCEGSYTWNIEQGHYGDVRLDGINVSEFGSFPGPVHEGNGTLLFLIDEKTSADQREALETMLTTILPFSVFYNLTTNFLGFRYVPFDLQLNGIHSRLTIPGTVELVLTPMKNPVTGEDELATLLKPTGFTSKRQELCATQTFRLKTEGLSYDHSGKYGEFSPFEYAPT